MNATASSGEILISTLPVKGGGMGASMAGLGNWPEFENQLHSVYGVQFCPFYVTDFQEWVF
jgi:hypothetical protein